MKTIYVLVYYFWVSEGEWAKEYVDVFTNEQKARAALTSTAIVYGVGKKIPKESDGDCYSPGFYQIIAKQLDV